jgi:hypothetical protein
MDKNEISEEVSTTPIIRDVERLFVRGFGSIKWLIVQVFIGLGNFLRFSLRHAMILLAVGIIGGAVGYFSTEIIPRQYASSLILKLNVNSKPQLENDIIYFNSLISKKETETLANLFQITTSEAASLSGFEMFSHSTYVEKLMGLNEVYNNLDTGLVRLMDVEKLANSDDPTFSTLFKITIYSSDEAVFSKLEKPLMTYLEKSEELKLLLESSQKALAFQREVYVKEMQTIDTLTKYMNQAMLANAQSGASKTDETYIMLGAENKTSRPVNAIDLQDKYIFYAQKIAKIDVSIQEHQTVYFVNSHLNPYGEKIGYGGLMRALIGSISLFLVTSLIIYLVKIRKKLG